DNGLWGTSACCFDFDRDGWLDLVIVNYVDYSPGRPCCAPVSAGQSNSSPITSWPTPNFLDVGTARTTAGARSRPCATPCATNQTSPPLTPLWASNLLGTARKPMP